MKESEFNASKLQQRKIEAAAANSLLDLELSDGFLRDAAAALDQARKNRVKRARRENKVARQVERGDVPAPSSLIQCTIQIPDELRVAAMDSVQLLT